MAEIVFIQNLPYEYPGTGLISAALKQHGHRTKVIIGRHFCFFENQLKPEQIIAFSIMTGMQQWALNIAARIKEKFGCFIIMGGPHPTYYPEIIENPYLDAICRGEGEYPMLDLAEARDKNSDITRIANLWVKKDGVLYKNAPRPLISDPDILPNQDRELYYRNYPLLRNNPHKSFIAGRGCPFACSFCFNQQLRELYRDKGKFVRFRRPESIIAEIEQVKAHYNLNNVFFHDDTFILDTQWLDEFLYLYEKRIGLPFYCSGRADTITEEIAKRLQQANCRVVSFAVESGNERLRKDILKKNITNTQLIEAAQTLKHHRIKLLTFNMVGIPAETVDDAWDTVNINIRMGVDYPRCSFLTPYPGLQITEYAKNNGYFDAVVEQITTFSQQTQSLIKNRDHDRLINMHHFFQTAVLFPRSIPIIKLLVKLPPNLIYQLWWAIVYFFVFSIGEGRGIWRMMIFSLRIWVPNINYGHKRIYDKGLENRYYFKNFSRRFRFPKAKYNRDIQDYIYSFIYNLPSGSNILDACCGDGYLSSLYLGRYKVVGFDCEDEAIEYCKKKYPQGNYFKADIYHIPIKDNYFDGIILSMAIEHFKNPAGALEELKRVLKNNGLIIVITPNEGALLWKLTEHTWFRFFGGSCKPYRRDVHPSPFTKDELKSLILKQFSLQGIKTLTYGMTLAASARK